MALLVTMETGWPLSGQPVESGIRHALPWGTTAMRGAGMGRERPRLRTGVPDMAQKIFVARMTQNTAEAGNPNSAEIPNGRYPIGKPQYISL